MVRAFQHEPCLDPGSSIWYEMRTLLLSLRAADGSVGEGPVHQPIFHGITDSSICILFVKYRLVYFAKDTYVCRAVCQRCYVQQAFDSCMLVLMVWRVSF